MTTELLQYLAAGRGVAAILKLLGVDRLARKLLESRNGIVRATGFEFFPGRAEMDSARNLEKQLRDAKTVKMILVGGSKLIEAQTNLGAVKKVLLPHPQSQSLCHYAETVADKVALPAKIIGTTTLLQSKGIAVRWYPHLINHAVIIADPDQDSGWAQWESVLPFAPLPERSCVVVSKQKYGNLVGSINDSFERMFADAAIPPVPPTRA